MDPEHKLKKKLKNSSKKLETQAKKTQKSAFFETLFAGNASKKEACIRKYVLKVRIL